MLGDCPPKPYMGEPVTNPYWERKQLQENPNSQDNGFFGSAVPTELRPSHPIPGSNSVEIDSNLIADAGTSPDFTDTTFPPVDDLGNWS